jgi:hypothetical protein
MRYKRALADLPRLVSTLRFYSRFLPGNFLLGVATEKVREDQLMYIDGTGCNVSSLHKGRHLLLIMSIDRGSAQSSRL